MHPIAAALILGDKTDVRRSRVRNHDITSFDIHDRVNYSVKKAATKINGDHTAVELKLTIDTEHFSAMEYFEIFLARMLLCRKAAAKLAWNSMSLSMANTWFNPGPYALVDILQLSRFGFSSTDASLKWASSPQ